MKVQTQIKAGGIGLNHNQTLVRRTTQTKQIGGQGGVNHNQTLVRKAS